MWRGWQHKRKAATPGGERRLAHVTMHIPRRQANRVFGFTLVELLVVIGIVALLMGILLPTLRRARLSSQVVKAKADLRSIAAALSIYRQEHKGKLPPTRFSCSNRTEYQLPVELAQGEYLLSETREFGLIVKMPDVFNPGDTYKYRAPGPAILNESTLISDAATIWVPDGFPDCDGTKGKYYNHAEDSPVLYALWSVGPVPNSPKLGIPGRAPVPSRYWYRGTRDGGVITIFEDQRGRTYIGP
jgi:prepilin-type N-terminal cleavage/methylation domain-containing protein